ncbi:MAG: hypothetical protein PHQ52_04645, partial [Candidatus Omnitrophica bacterium]|nr:hypothetical protein [Candidatus Omnitrophota bacterium]
DDPATPEVEPDYNYTTFTGTFEKAYQLYQFYMGLSSTDKTNFENLYGLDMFVIVTMMYDLDGDGVYETPYDYAAFTGNFNGTKALNDALVAQGLKDEFVALFVNGSVNYEQALLGVVTGLDFNRTAFLDVLPKAYSLHNALSGAGESGQIYTYREAFEMLYGVAIADQMPDANAIYRKLLFDIAGDTGKVDDPSTPEVNEYIPPFNEETFLRLLPLAADYHVLMHSYRDEFEQMYDIPVAEQDPVTNLKYREILFSLVGDPAYNRDNIIIIRIIGLDYKIEEEGLREEFETIFGTPVAEQVFTDEAYREVLTGILTDPNFVQTNFLEGLPKVAALYSALGAYNGYITAVYGISDQDPKTNPDYRKLLFDITGDTEYVQAEFVNALADVVDLNNAVGAYRNIIAALYNIPSNAQVMSTNTVYRQLMFDLVGDPAYSQTTFVLRLDCIKKIDQDIQSSQNAFAAIYGILPSQQILINDDYLAAILAVVDTPAGPVYDANYIGVVIKAASLHDALAPFRDEFASRYGISVADQDPINNLAYRTLLFNITGDPAYNEVDFIGSFEQGSELDDALADGHREAFETMFGIAVADQVMSNDIYTTLLSNISNDPSFEINAFIAGLDKAASLHDALSIYNEEFNAIYAVGQMNAGINVAYRTLLFNISGGASYDETAYVTALINAAELNDVLTEYDLRDAFAEVYGVAVNDQKAGKTNYINKLFSIVGDPSYDVDAFVDYFNGVIREYYDTGELKKRILPTGVIYEYYKSLVLKSETYPNVGTKQYLDENFYVGDPDHRTGRLISNQEFDGFTYYYFDYYPASDVAGKIVLYSNNGQLVETRYYYATGVMQRVERPDGSSEDYNADGILVYKVFSDGYEHGYDVQGRIISVINPSGKYYEQDYDNASYPGQVVRTIYSSSDKSVLIQTEIYSYTDVYDQATWTLDTVVMPDGFTMEYDDLGRLTKEISPSAYTVDYEYYELTTLIKKKTYTDIQTTYTVIYDYDPLKRLVKETSSNRVITYRYHRWTDQFLYVTVYVNGQFSHKIEYREDGTLKYRTETDRTMYYDVYGRLKAVTINGVSETFFFYANKDTLLYARQMATDLVTGETIIYFYREDGSAEKAINLSGWYAYYDEQGRVIKEQTAFDRFILYSYDGDSSQVTQKRIINLTLQRARVLIYDFNGILISDEYITDPINTRDGFGRIVKVENYDTSFITYTYFGTSNTVESVATTDMNGLVSKKIYDIDGRLVRQENHNDTWVDYTYNGSTTTIMREDFQDGSYNVYSYDVATGALATIVKINAFNRATTETYDLNTGLILESRTWDNKVTSYAYDALNRLKTMSTYYGTTETYTYYGDTNNVNVKTITYSSGYWYKYTYSETGLMLSSLYKGGTITTYNYDALDRLSGKVYGYYTYTYEYDGNTNKLLTEKSYYKGNLSSTTTYAYFDGSDIIRSRTYTYSGGSWYKYEYDMHTGAMIKMTSSYGYYNIYEYDELGRVSRTDSSYGFTAFYSYFGNSDQVKTMTYVDEEGRETFYEYNDLGQIVRSNGWYSIEEAVYSYDGYGRLLRIDFESGKYTLYTYYGDTNYTHEYAMYDSDGTYLSGISYEYYENWNIKKYTYSYNGQTTTYEYLPGGRIDKITTAEGITQYMYDAQGRVSSIFYPNGDKLVYGYDGTTTRTVRYTRYAADDSIISDQEWTYYGSSWIRATYKTTDNTGKTTFYEYNSNGRLTKVTTDYGTVDAVVGTYIYDSSGRNTRINYSNGNYETRKYSSSTWRIEQILKYYSEDNTSYIENYIYYGDGTLKQKDITYRDGTTQTSYYDEGNVLLMETLPDGRVVFYSEYDEYGRNIRKDYGEGDYVTITYDEQGNAIETYHPAPTIEGSADGAQQNSEVEDMLNLQQANKDLQDRLKELGIGSSSELGGPDGELVED